MSPERNRLRALPRTEFTVRSSSAAIASTKAPACTIDTKVTSSAGLYVRTASTLGAGLTWSVISIERIFPWIDFAEK